MPKGGKSASERYTNKLIKRFRKKRQNERFDHHAHKVPRRGYATKPAPAKSTLQIVKEWFEANSETLSAQDLFERKPSELYDVLSKKCKECKGFSKSAIMKSILQYKQSTIQKILEKRLKKGKVVTMEKLKEYLLEKYGVTKGVTKNLVDPILVHPDDDPEETLDFYNDFHGTDLSMGDILTNKRLAALFRTHNSPKKKSKKKSQSTSKKKSSSRSSSSNSSRQKRSKRKSKSKGQTERKRKRKTFQKVVLQGSAFGRAAGTYHVVEGKDGNCAVRKLYTKEVKSGRKYFYLKKNNPTRLLVLKEAFNIECSQHTNSFGEMTKIAKLWLRTLEKRYKDADSDQDMYEWILNDAIKRAGTTRLSGSTLNRMLLNMIGITYHIKVRKLTNERGEKEDIEVAVPDEGYNTEFALANLKRLYKNLKKRRKRSTSTGSGKQNTQAKKRKPKSKKSKSKKSANQRKGQAKKKKKKKPKKRDIKQIQAKEINKAIRDEVNDPKYGPEEDLVIESIRMGVAKRLRLKRNQVPARYKLPTEEILKHALRTFIRDKKAKKKKKNSQKPSYEDVKEDFIHQNFLHIYADQSEKRTTELEAEARAWLDKHKGELAPIIKVAPRRSTRKRRKPRR
jgi:hypothetical protein